MLDLDKIALKSSSGQDFKTVYDRNYFEYATYGATTLSVTTLSITTLSTLVLLAILNNITSLSIKYRYC